MRTIVTKLALFAALCCCAAPVIAQQFPCADIPALTGDASTTAGSCATTVNALKNVSLPSLTAGYLYYNGSAFSFSASGGMVWPSGSAGIPNYSGSSSWGTSYSASNLVPNDFLQPGSVQATFPTLAATSALYLGAQLAGTFPANFTGTGLTATVYCGTNPAATSTFTLTDVTSSTVIGTIAISTSCGLTLATTGGTSKSFSAGDRFTLQPGATDTNAANLQFIIQYTRN